MKKSCLLLVLVSLFVIACGDNDAPKAPNLALASLTVSSGTLTPAFAPAVTVYTVSVSNTVTNITVTAVATDAQAVVMYDPAQPAALTVGSNLITVRVVSQDGAATNTCRVTIYRISTNATLATLAASTGALSPSFNPSVMEYSIVAYVSNNISDGGISTGTAHAGATVTFPSGTTLTAGSNQLVVRVTAEDGTTTRDYTIRVYKMGADYTSVNIGALKYVPAGAFQRDGTVANISFVSAIRMSSTEITRSQYSNVMSADPANITFSTGVSDPVQVVNWYHAITFCNKLSIAEGLEPVYTVAGVDFTNLAHASIPLTNDATWNAASNNWVATGYRLPTEMEWMWAAMGAQMGSDPFAVNTTGSGKAFAGSTGSNSIEDYAWYSLNSSKTQPAGSKLPNELGLSDMSGNVWEWCWDWYGSYPAGYQAVYRGAASGTSRILRGGSWPYDASTCTVAWRNYYVPFDRDSTVGFRVVRP